MFGNIEYTEAMSVEVQREYDIRAMLMMYHESMTNIADAIEGALLYGEAEGEGFFSKIAAGTRNVVKGLIEFVSKLVSSILGFVLRPFGVKIKVKESSGGGGGGSSSSSSSSSDNGLSIEVTKAKTMSFQNGKVFNMEAFHIPHTPTIVTDYINSMGQETRKELGKGAQDKIWLKAVNLTDKERKKILLSGSSISPSDIQTAMNIIMGKIRPVAGKLNKYTAYRFDDSVKIKDEAKFISDNIDMNVYMNAIKGTGNISYSANKIFDFGEVTVIHAKGRTGSNIEGNAEAMVNYMSMFIQLLKGVDYFMNRSSSGSKNTSYIAIRKNSMNTFVKKVKGPQAALFKGIMARSNDGKSSIKELMTKIVNGITDPVLKKVAGRYLGLSTDQLTKDEGKTFVTKVLDCGVNSYSADDSIKLVNDMTGFVAFNFKDVNKKLAGQKKIVDEARKVTESDFDSKGLNEAAENPKVIAGNIRDDLAYMRDSLQSLTVAHTEFNDMVLAIQSSQIMPYTICTIIEFDIYVRMLGSVYAVASDRFNQTDGDIKAKFKAVMQEVDKNYKSCTSLVKGV